MADALQIGAEQLGGEADATGAEAFRVLTGGRELDGACRFYSLTVKVLFVFEEETEPGVQPNGIAAASLAQDVEQR